MPATTGKVKLPLSVVTELINKAKDTSTIAALSAAQPVTFADQTHLVFNPTSEAEVVAEGAKKGAYEIDLKPVEGKRFKVVTTTRVSDELKWAGTTADGVNGPKTKKALCKMLQKELNRQYKAGLSVDGVWGPKTKASCVNVKQGAKGNITKTLQGCLIVRGYGTNGFDGVFGGGTAKAVKAFQRSKGLTVDGVAGKNTWAKLLG